MTDLAKANPRPWRPNHDPRWSIAEIVAANGIKVARGVHPIDAALIAAAVNAYDPTRDDTAALDALSALSAEHEEKMAALRAERDELREALRQMRRALHLIGAQCSTPNAAASAGCRMILKTVYHNKAIVDAALAKADGTKPEGAA